MSEAIREILFHVTPDGIEPSGPQPAGIQGEHNATEVKFQLDEALVKDGYFYRFEFVDGTGGMYTTDFVTPEGNAVAVKIPAAWTASGGCGTLRLCVAELSEDYQEEMVVLSFAGRLLFSGRDSTSPLYSYYEPGLSGLIESTHAAAENANTAADEAREAAQGADEAAEAAQQAKAAADSAAQGAREAEADAEAAAAEARKAKADADAASTDAVQAAEEAREAAGEAGRAADAADKAAADASTVAQTVQNKLDAGKFKGEKGDKGDQGDPGVSGVYVGSGAMPEGYNVQVDPEGELTCYTADEADALFLKKAEATDGWTKGEADDRFANALKGSASGELVRLEDVSPSGAFSRLAALGETIETGTGNKGPENPYTLSGAKPAALTVCGRNLLDVPLVTYNNRLQTSKLLCLPPGTYYINCEGYTVSKPMWQVKGGNEWIDNPSLDEIWLYGTPISTVKDTFTVTGEYRYICFRMWMEMSEYGVDETARISISTVQDEPYEPYAGQSVSLPEGLELYGAGGVSDEYDAASGTLTRRLAVKVLNGKETWTRHLNSDVNPHGIATYYCVVDGSYDNAVFANTLPCRCSHYAILEGQSSATADRDGITFSTPWADKRAIYIYSTEPSVEEFKTFLAGQSAAGTPVTVVYPLAEAAAEEPGEPARIVPPAPVCQVYADAGEAAVVYNRDVNLAMAGMDKRIAALEEALATLLMDN